MTTSASAFDLRVNGHTAPLGMETRPRLSWVSPVRTQTAYEIQVGSTPGGSDVWASGKVDSSASVAVVYDGPPMTSGREYHWRVRVWDEQNAPLEWSAPSTWEAGLLEPRDWHDAAWIGGRHPQDHERADLHATVRFAGGEHPTTGLTFLFRAEPVGKT